MKRKIKNTPVSGFVFSINYNRQNRMRPTSSIINYFESHGIRVQTPEKLLSFNCPENKPALSSLIYVSYINENKSELPMKYEMVQEFINNLPEFHKTQLKRLLFALFYHSVPIMIKEKAMANDFFIKHRYDHHAFHEHDINHLKKLIDENNPNTASNPIFDTKFSTSLTEIAFNSLISFCSENNCATFLYILDHYLDLTYVPLDQCASIPDLFSGFILHSSDTSSQGGQKPQILLRANCLYDLARNFPADKKQDSNSGPIPEIFEDVSRMSANIPLPDYTIEQIAKQYRNFVEMAKLSKNDLPSCAYFSFPSEDRYYDINSNGSLIAVGTCSGIIKLISTNPNTDIDDLPEHTILTAQNNSTSSSSPVNHLLVPRCMKGNYSFHRSMIGPKSYCGRFSPDSRLFLAGCNGCLRLWTCEHNGAFSQPSVYYGGIVWAVDWSPMGHHFVYGTDTGKAELMSIDNALPIRLFDFHREPITDIKYHPNALTIATSSEDKSIRLWDIRSGSSPKPYADSIYVPKVLCFTRNGRYLFSGDEHGKLTIWDLREEHKIGSVKAHNGRIRDISFSVEGSIVATCGGNGEIHLWDTGSLCCSTASQTEPIKRLIPRNCSTKRVEFSCKNLLFALGNKE